MRRAYRLYLTLGLAFIASTSAALAKDSVTIGMVLEPPGLDPTSAPAAAIGEVTDRKSVVRERVCSTV